MFNTGNICEPYCYDDALLIRKDMLAVNRELHYCSSWPMGYTEREWHRVLWFRLKELERLESAVVSSLTADDRIKYNSL